MIRHDAAANSPTNSGHRSGRSGRCRDTASGTRDYVSEIRYDELGQRTFIQYGNGVTTRYNANAVTRRMDSLETDSPVAGALQRLNYTYFADGNIASIWTGGTPTPAPNLAQVWQSFAYDDLNQLTGAWGYHTRDGGGEHSYSLSMSYDRIHNITNKTQSVWATPGPGGSWSQVAATSHDFTYLYKNGRPHAASSVGARSIEYDPSGNQTFVVDSTTGAARTMVWDDDDRLMQVVDSSSTVSFRYNASGTRTHKVSSAGVTVYVNQYYTVCNGTKVTKHIFAGPQRVASVVDSGPSEQRLFLHTNHLGSTEFVTTATGAVTEHYEQLPFGEGWVEEVGSSGSSVPYRFTGKEIDEETGLYYFGARHYDPATGLWLSTDPAMRDHASGTSASGGLSSPANLNAYAYGWNSPVRMTDPDGRDVVVVSSSNVQDSLYFRAGGVTATATASGAPMFSNDPLLLRAANTLDSSRVFSPSAFGLSIAPVDSSVRVHTVQVVERSSTMTWVANGQIWQREVAGNTPVNRGRELLFNRDQMGRAPLVDAQGDNPTYEQCGPNASDPRSGGIATVDAPTVGAAAMRERADFWLPGGRIRGTFQVSTTFRQHVFLNGQLAGWIEREVIEQLTESGEYRAFQLAPRFGHEVDPDHMSAIDRKFPSAGPNGQYSSATDFLQRAPTQQSTPRSADTSCR